MANNTENNKQPIFGFAAVFRSVQVISVFICVLFAYSISLIAETSFFEKINTTSPCALVQKYRLQKSSTLFYVYLYTFLIRYAWNSAKETFLSFAIFNHCCCSSFEHKHNSSAVLKSMAVSSSSPSLKFTKSFTRFWTYLRVAFFVLAQLSCWKIKSPQVEYFVGRSFPALYLFNLLLSWACASLYTLFSS